MQYAALPDAKSSGVYRGGPPPEGIMVSKKVYLRKLPIGLRINPTIMRALTAIGIVTVTAA